MPRWAVRGATGTRVAVFCLRRTSSVYGLDGVYLLPSVVCPLFYLLYISQHNYYAQLLYLPQCPLCCSDYLGLLHQSSCPAEEGRSVGSQLQSNEIYSQLSFAIARLSKDWPEGLLECRNCLGMTDRSSRLHPKANPSHYRHVRSSMYSLSSLRCRPFMMQGSIRVRRTGTWAVNFSIPWSSVHLGSL